MNAVSISHPVGARAADVGDGAGLAPPSPPAVRRRTSRWTDPRLWVGVVLVLASVVAGAKVLAAADDTVAVWSAQHDLVAGSPIGAGDVRLTRVHFADDTAGRLYLPATESLPADARLTRDLSAGELIALSAVTTRASTAQQLLPLAVTGAGVPAGLAPGDRVDVWAVVAPDRGRARSVKVLDDAAVTGVSGAAPGGFGSDREVLVALPDGTDVARALTSLSGASVVLIQNGA